MVLAVTGCGRKVTPATGPGARVAVLEPWQSISPILERSAAARVVEGAYSRGFASQASDGSLRLQWLREQPARASQTYAPLGGAMAEYHLTLRPDAVWEDGSPLTFEDFLLAYRLAANPLFLPRHEPWVRGVKSLEVTAGTPLRMVVLRSPRVDFLDVFALPSKAVQGEAYSHPVDFPSSPYHQKPASTGPFRIEAVASGRASLRANDRFVVRRPHLQWLEVEQSASVAAALRDLSQGKFDVVGPIPEAEAQAFVAGPSVRMVQTPSRTLVSLVFNTRHAVLRHVSLRRAVARSLERAALVERLGPFKAVATQSWLPPTHAGYDPSFAVYRCDPKAARKAFTHASPWKLRPDGQLVTRGRAEALTLLYDSDSPVHKACADLIHANLKAVGVELVLQGRTHAVYDAELRARTCALALGELDIVPWALPVTWFGQESIPTSRNGLRGSNVSGYVSAANERLLRSLGGEACWLDARADLRAHQRLLAADLPLLPLFYRVDNTGVSSALEGVRPQGYGPITWNVEDWQRR